jgi:hypothetical protein
MVVLEFSGHESQELERLWGEVFCKFGLYSSGQEDWMWGCYGGGEHFVDELVDPWKGQVVLPFGRGLVFGWRGLSYEDKF